MSDQFAGYRTILALSQKNRTKKAFRDAVTAAGIQNFETAPIPGYYRLQRGKDGPFDPVGIWFDDNQELVIYWGADPARLEHVWPKAFWNPVSYEDWNAAMEGKGWPDTHYLDPAELDPIEQMIGPKNAEPGPGHNSGATLDEVAELGKKIDIALAGVKKYEKIDSDEARDRSQTLRSDLLKYSREAKKTREALDAPHKAEIEKNKKTWKPLEDKAADGANAIRAAQEAWETVKLRRQQEETRRRQEEERQREAALQAQVEEANAAIERGETPGELTYVPPVTAPVAPTAPEAAFRGGSGRAAHVKPVEVIKEENVEDWSKLFLYFLNDKDARAYMLKRANSILKSHGEVAPGCTTQAVAKVA